MSKKVFILSSSLRKGGNSDVLADEFARGAKESGHSVEKICIRDIELKFCVGCLHCQSHDICVIKDDVNALLPKVQSSDVLVFATPIYYYEMCGQLKTFLDRLNPLFAKDNRFKDVYLLATAADSDESAMDGAIKGIQGWIECFNGVRLAGVVNGIGVEKVGDIAKTSATQQAYNLGKSI